MQISFPCLDNATKVANILKHFSLNYHAHIWQSPFHQLTHVSKNLNKRKKQIKLKKNSKNGHEKTAFLIDF